ncbi:MAG TPA: hypothetical protein VK139_04820 [Microbacteriaceae bacterium]|nr:hypothetical protein [Microbacteriaceae bacterium]
MDEWNIMNENTAPDAPEDVETGPADNEIELTDEALELASGGAVGDINSTEIVFASTFIPFDSSF